MKLLFVRHGQTDFNREGRMMGQEFDLPLNAVGIAQVENTALFLSHDIAAIISSPLKRAHQTAEIINKKLHKKIELNDDIKEMSYGSLAGKTWSEIEAETGDNTAHEKDTDVTFDYRPYGGETAENFKRRVAKFVGELKSRYENKIVLVTSHGGVIDVMHILFPQGERPASDNARIHEFDL